MFIDIRYGSRARAPEERNVSGEENSPFRRWSEENLLQLRVL